MMNQNNNTLVNRVANSGIITIKLEDFLPNEQVVTFDLKDFLFKELILKEKDFRAALKEHDWTQYQEKVLCVLCSTDAIIPVWAYMLVSVYAKPHAKVVFQGNQKKYQEMILLSKIKNIDAADYEGKRVVIKGCSDRWVPESAYLSIAAKLQPTVQSLMYGEPCSTVPLFKRPRKV